jgi:hypothetical protein
MCTPAAPGDVHAIERQHHGQSQPLHLERQPQADGQVHGVDHAHHQFRRGRVGQAAEQHVTGDGLVERGRIEAVGARQVEHAHAAAVRRGALALAPLDRDTRVVSDLLAAAGQAVEQRGLAAIGNADQRDAQRCDCGVHCWRARRNQAVTALDPACATTSRA